MAAVNTVLNQMHRAQTIIERGLTSNLMLMSNISLTKSYWIYKVHNILW